MEKIMIDMDNVITDGNFNKIIEEYFKIKVDMNKEKSYYYVQKYANKNKENFWNYVKDKNFYSNAKLLDGCFETLKQLAEKYDLYIVTSYLWIETIDLSGENLKNKYNYLRENLPFIKPENYIFTTNKNILNFDIKIDDKPENLKNAKIKLLFTAWHNKDLTDETLTNKNYIRVNNWHEILEILNK